MIRGKSGCRLVLTWKMTEVNREVFQYVEKIQKRKT